MAKRKNQSLFSRLMISVSLPEIIIFTIVAIISYIQLKELFQDLSKEKVENLQSELRSIIRFQDVSLSQISKDLDKEGQDKMKELRFHYFLNSDSIESADLSRIRREISMKEDNDIYIINKRGVVVNTTFEKDHNRNLFDLSDKLKVFLLDMFEHDFYTAEAMSLETSTRKFKKYIYQRSKDHKYIIQLGFYSSEADKFNSVIAKRLKEIEDSPNDIKSIDLILAPWNPFSLYTQEDVKGDEIPIIQSIFEQKKDSLIEGEEERISYLHFDLSDNSTISWRGILRVAYDRQRERSTLITSLVQKISLFGIGMIILLAILFVNVKTVVKPLHSLSNSARKLGEGLLNERAKSEGSKEMLFLSESFNQMAANLEKSHLEITKKSKEILASITYAKRIQEAILPPSHLMNEGLPEHFILYKPKDIVAGDFYWFKEIGDDIFIASADCTGHGVPGAMVSVVCSNSLNRAVNELKLKEPAQILNAVRDLVIETFTQSDHNVKDGMDICFCRINKKKKEVVYAGAQNSLYRICKHDESLVNSKNITDNEDMLIDYRADKQPIGSFTSKKPFSQTVIKYNPGEIIYLFTDGFADQFGGPDGRKFMYKPFKKLLISIKNESMQDQKEKLENAFEDWRKNEEQIDDVCIIGIKLS